MYALITGGTSGIGKEIANILDEKGYSLYIVGSRKEYPEISNYKDAHYLSHNLQDLEEAKKLLDEVEDIDFDVFIDNAGYGDISSLFTSDDEKEMNMIDLNCKTMQYLLKKMIIKMEDKKGHILVTSSMAAYSPSAYMSTYYATKAYDYYLALGYRRELKDRHSSLTLSVLCPGPVETEFSNRANVTFKIKPVSAKKVAKLAVKKMFKGKAIIIPTLKCKILALLSKTAPTLLSTYVASKSAKDRHK